MEEELNAVKRAAAELQTRMGTLISSIESAISEEEAKTEASDTMLDGWRDMQATLEEASNLCTSLDELVLPEPTEETEGEE